MLTNSSTRRTEQHGFVHLVPPRYRAASASASSSAPAAAADPSQLLCSLRPYEPVGNSSPSEPRARTLQLTSRPLLGTAQAGTTHIMAATTPMRPVPGAFLNTPAPAADPLRRDLFGAGGSRRGPLGTSPPRQHAVNRFPPLAARPASPPPATGPPALPPTVQSAIENTPPAQRAARFVNELLQLDGSFPDLDSYCRRKCIKISRLLKLLHLDGPHTE